MSTHKAQMQWRRETPDFTYETYSRDHDVTTGSGVNIPASAAPEYKGSATRQNPEEALVGALSSCHFLTFLAVAAKRGFTVDSYRDAAEGVLEKNAEGRLAITRVTLSPTVAFSGAKVPTVQELEALHARAHEGCFIANSVKAAVTVVPQPLG